MERMKQEAENEPSYQDQILGDIDVTEDEDAGE